MNKVSVNFKDYNNREGLTVIELVAIMGVILIIASLLVAVSPRLIRSAQAAQCMSNLRALHTAFSNYLTDSGSWPQVPEDVQDNEDLYSNWWIEKMLPNGISRQTWICPTIKNMQKGLPERDKSNMHYTPTEFDENPITPRRWPRMPWFVEIANAHGNGALIIFADGSIEAGETFFPN